MSRMLNNNDKSNEQAVLSSPKPSIKRNLFGIRLNHEQLKEDLKEMVKEQMETKKYKWNFDFEALKPLAQAPAAPSSRKLFSEDSTESSIRFKWAKINTIYSSSDPEMAMSTFDKTELGYAKNYNFIMSDGEEDEEEDDDALAIPQFYKHQRKMKLNEEKNRLKYLKPTRPSSAMSERIDSARGFEPIFKFAQKSNLPKTNTKKQQPRKTTKIAKPKAVKRANQTSLALSPSTQNLIITFSENRKDTLRSAQHVRTRSRLTQANANQAKKSPVGASASSAFAPAEQNLKQQTLLDMFKQRKRRNSATIANEKLIATSSRSASHCLV